MTPMAIAPPSGSKTVGVGAGADEGTELAATVVTRVGMVRGVANSSARGTSAGAQAMSRPSVKNIVRNVVMLGLVFMWSFKIILPKSHRINSASKNLQVGLSRLYAYSAVSFNQWRFLEIQFASAVDKE